MMQSNHIWHDLNTQYALAERLAKQIVDILQRAIDSKGQAVLAVSGGSTPKQLFAALANRSLDWQKVVITLVDERWVPLEHELSNANFVNQHLLAGLNQVPVCVPLFAFSAAALTPELALIPILNDYCRQTNSTLAAPAKFDVVVLGMGEDGHTASFFPDAENIVELVDQNNPNRLLNCHSPSSNVARITWSLPMLLDTEFLALHIHGKSKKAVFDTAVEGDCLRTLPIRSAIFQNQTPLHVYYAD